MRSLAAGGTLTVRLDCDAAPLPLAKATRTAPIATAANAAPAIVPCLFSTAFIRSAKSLNPKACITPIWLTGSLDAKRGGGVRAFGDLAEIVAGAIKPASADAQDRIKRQPIPGIVGANSA